MHGNMNVKLFMLYKIIFAVFMMIISSSIGISISFSVITLLGNNCRAL